MILSPVLPLGADEQQEVIRVETRVNAAIREYHNNGKDPVVFVPFDMSENVRKNVQRSIRAEGWRVKAEKGTDTISGGWETWALSPQKKALLPA